MYSEQEKLDFQKIEKEENIYYSFFTSGLLHWVFHSNHIIGKKCSRFFIAAGLTEQEKARFENYIDFPIFYIKDSCTDKDIWNLLFDTCNKNFGWIDIDCFINCKDVFDKMSHIDTKILFNSYWTEYKNTNIEFINTFFVFVNVKAVKDIKSRQLSVTPYTYTYKNTDHKGSRIIQREWYPYIKKYMPLFTYPFDIKELQWPPFFDTLLLYQIIAKYCGYEIANIQKKYFANTLHAFHIGQCIHYSYIDMQKGQINDVIVEIIKHKANKNIETKCTIAYDPTNNWKSVLLYYILDKYLSILPIEYNILKKYIVKQLADNGLKSDQYKNYLFKLAHKNKDFNVVHILQLLDIHIP